MADRCDVPGCEETAHSWFLRQRCLAHTDAQAPSLRSDEPRPSPLPIGEAERRVWRQRVRVLLHREIDARHAAARAEARTAEVERILTNWPADGAYALRVLRGETR